MSLLQAMGENFPNYIMLASLLIGLLLLVAGGLMLTLPVARMTDVLTDDDVITLVYGSAAVGIGAMLLLLSTVTRLAKDIWSHVRPNSGESNGRDS